MRSLTTAWLILLLVGCASLPEGSPPQNLGANIFVPSSVTAEDVEHRCNGHFQGEHWKYPFAISHVWYPTRQQVERVDQLLSTTITKQARSLRPEMDLDYSDYQRQFIGFRSRGKNYIFAVGKRSGVLELKDRPPTKFLFDLCGGGTWFWSAAYELEANKLVDTSFNADK